MLALTSGALTAGMIALTSIAVTLAAFKSLGMGTTEIVAWITIVYTLKAAASFAFSRYYRQPIMFSWNIPAVLLIAASSGQSSVAEIQGTLIVTGLLMLVSAHFGLIKKMSAWIPAPIVMGMFGGVVFQFVIAPFTSLNEFPLMIGLSILAYFASMRVFGSRVPPVLPALLTGLIFLIFNAQPVSWAEAPLLPTLSWPSAPAFSLKSALTLGPVLMIVINLQATLAGLVLLKVQDYDPPARQLEGAVGLMTSFLSIFVIAPFCLAPLLIAPLVDPSVGEKSVRYKSAQIAAGMALAIALFSGVIVAVLANLPMPFLLAIVGLSLVRVFQDSIRHVSQGPLILGPVFAFIVSASKANLFGLGASVWAIPVGLGISWLLEREQMKKLASSVVDSPKVSAQKDQIKVSKAV